MSRPPHTYTHSHLVIRAVGAGHELAVGLQGGEPRLQIQLLRSGVVQLARHDVHHVEGEAQALLDTKTHTLTLSHSIARKRNARDRHVVEVQEGGHVEGHAPCRSPLRWRSSPPASPRTPRGW